MKTNHMEMDEKFCVTPMSMKVNSSLVNSLVTEDIFFTQVDPTKASGFRVTSMARESSLLRKGTSSKASLKSTRNMAKVVSTS